MNAIEQRLAAQCGRKHTIFTASGSTALGLVLGWLRECNGPGEVIVPAVTCPAVAQAVRYAGHVAVFADIALSDATIDVEHAKQLINDRTRAIVPIHIFGHAAPIDEFVNLTSGTQIAVIEDAAQAIGGTIGTSPIGSFGTFSILSFGGTKIIDAGAGGAILLDDSAAEAALRASQDRLPVLQREHLKLLELSQRNFYHAFTDVLRVEPSTNVSDAFNALLPAYRDVYLRRLDCTGELFPSIESGLDGLATSLQHRRRIAEVYTEGLLPLRDHVQFSDAWRTSGAVWRYMLLCALPEDAIALTSELRRHGFPASNHYWSAARLFKDLELSRADRFSRLVLNLWVDHSVNETKARETVNIIERFFTRAD